MQNSCFTYLMNHQKLFKYNLKNECYKTDSRSRLNLAVKYFHSTLFFFPLFSGNFSLHFSLNSLKLMLKFYLSLTFFSQCLPHMPTLISACPCLSSFSDFFPFPFSPSPLPYFTFNYDFCNFFCPLRIRH